MVKEELERLERFESVFVDPDAEAELEADVEAEIDSEFVPLELLVSPPEVWLGDDGGLLLLFNGKLEIVFPSPYTTLCEPKWPNIYCRWSY